MPLLAALLAVLCCLPAAAASDKNYECDYLQSVFNSDNGLEGTAVKCITASSDGFLWMGSYTGLYRYDGSEFKKYLIDGRTIVVNDIVEDAQGRLWLATNGSGIYYFDGETFTQCNGTQLPDGSDIVNTLLLREDGALFAGTKNGLLTLTVTDETPTVYAVADTEGMDIRGIAMLDDGEKILVRQNGGVHITDGGTVRTLPLDGAPQGCTPRSITAAGDGSIYIGTTESSILKIDRSGKVLAVIDCGSLFTINAIQEITPGKYWVCSDTGIGILQNDAVTPQRFLVSDSIEEMCTDYQGGIWFASSRQGILQLYENGFSDLGSYWGLHDTVNALQKHGDLIYAATDNGLFAYRGKERVDTPLTEDCTGERIRHLYTDSAGNLWVSTYRDGVKRLNTDGTITTFNTENSGLTTNQTRCVWQAADGTVYLGTEQGLFAERDDVITRPVQDDVLNMRRILDIADYDGVVYAATDGYGLYEIRDGAVAAVWNKQRGLRSDIIMKVVPSTDCGGVWLVTGEDIYLLSPQGVLQHAPDEGIADARDLLVLGDGYAAVLAGNGIFYQEESELLAGSSMYLHYNRRDGLPIDFTANASSTYADGMLYMCGTNGVAGFDLESEVPERELRLFLNAVTADGEELPVIDGEVTVPADTNRLTIDVRPLDYVHQNVYIGYQLEGLDEVVDYMPDDIAQEISYTNLAGGDYTYHVYVSLYGSNQLAAEFTLPIHKTFRFWEEPRVRCLLLFGFAAVLLLVFLLVQAVRERTMQARFTVRLRRATDAELAKAAYTDLVTGVYNRNRFEIERSRLKPGNAYAFFSVSVNYRDYIQSKYGSFYFEGLLRAAVEAIRATAPERVDIYRVSENVFYFWLKDAVDLEGYVRLLKAHFSTQAKDGVPATLAVGAVYNNAVENDNITDLFDRCEKMRLMDEKHADAEFIEGKMKML